MNFNTSNDRMYISMETMKSLKIFEDEEHPNLLQRNSKEGLSLFGL